MGTSVAGHRTRILVITIEIELFRLVRSVLKLGGFTVHSAGSSGGGSKMDGPFEVVGFDLPSLDLDDLREAKRTYPDAQFVAICGGYRESDCITLLDMDVDYLARPFRAEDLSARVRVAALRRFNLTGRRRYYRHGSFVIDRFDRSVAIEGKRISLAPSELRLLMLLASEPGRVVTLGQILAGLGRDDSASGRKFLRTTVSRLRRRIERDPQRPDLLLTEARVGYRLETETDNTMNLDVPAPRRERKEDRLDRSSVEPRS